MGDQWFFIDQQGKVQGPFKAVEMRAWFEVGYLSADLMISNGDPRKNQFKPLSQFFPSGATAFVEGGPDTSVTEQWYFVDRNQQTQGPFSSLHMRQWMMEGYFEPSLLIINTAVPGAQWKKLGDTFPNVSDAFAVAPGNAPSPGGASRGAGGARGGGADDPRFAFPEWLPVPPRYRGVKKVYPSEKNGGKRRVAIRDVHGQQVNEFNHFK